MKRLVLAVVCTLLVAGIVSLIIWLERPLIPVNISRQVNFGLFYPNPAGSETVIASSSIKYDAQSSTFSLAAKFDGRLINFTEQSTPEQFIDVSGYYSALINTLNGYASFQNVIGQVDLTRPAETKRETAIMNAKGTLVFAASTNGDLSVSAWKTLFNSLKFTQPQ